jgi:hypothetical protein
MHRQLPGEMYATILCKQRKRNQTCWFLCSFDRNGSHKGEANYAKKVSQKMLDAVDQVPLDLVRYGLCHIMKEVTISSSLLRAHLCGPRVALMQHHGEVFKSRGQSAEIISIILFIFFKKKHAI